VLGSSGGSVARQKIGVPASSGRCGVPSGGGAGPRRGRRRSRRSASGSVDLTEGHVSVAPLDTKLVIDQHGTAASSGFARQER
jgi:hypothetical protein